MREVAHCFGCGAKTRKPLQKRSVCKCGSRAWYVGTKPEPLWRSYVPFLTISTEEQALIEACQQSAARPSSPAQRN